MLPARRSPPYTDVLSDVLSPARALNVPLPDPDLGPTPTLRRLREAKGLIVAAADAVICGQV